MHKKNCFDQNLGESLCIFTSFHFPDSGLNLLTGFDFYFDLFWIAWHWKPAIFSSVSHFSKFDSLSSVAHFSKCDPFFPVWLFFSKSDQFFQAVLFIFPSASHFSICNPFFCVWWQFCSSTSLVFTLGWLFTLGWHLAVVVKLVCLHDPESCAGEDFVPWQV